MRNLFNSRPSAAARTVIFQQYSGTLPRKPRKPIFGLVMISTAPEFPGPGLLLRSWGPGQPRTHHHGNPDFCDMIFSREKSCHPFGGISKSQEE